MSVEKGAAAFSSSRASEFPEFARRLLAVGDGGVDEFAAADAAEGHALLRERVDEEPAVRVVVGVAVLASWRRGDWLTRSCSCPQSPTRSSGRPGRRDRPGRTPSSTRPGRGWGPGVTGCPRTCSRARRRRARPGGPGRGYARGSEGEGDVREEEDDDAIGGARRAGEGCCCSPATGRGAEGRGLLVTRKGDAPAAHRTLARRRRGGSRATRGRDARRRVEAGRARARERARCRASRRRSEPSPRRRRERSPRAPSRRRGGGEGARGSVPREREALVETPRATRRRARRKRRRCVAGASRDRGGR